MHNTELVSVIVPCFNYGHFLPKALDSVLGQTYENIETIIIDDGSKDNTKKIVDEYIAKHPKIKYIYQDNKGVVATRNRCLKEAEGKYLVMLDADDFLDADYIEKTVKIAEEKDAHIVYTDAKLFGAKNTTTSFPEFNVEELKNHNYIHISSLILVKEARKHEFDSYLTNKTHEDWDFFLGMCLSGAKALRCKSTFLNYRIHEEGRNNKLEDLKSRVKYIEVYLYIIKKYEKKYKDKISYLAGKEIGAWYFALYENLIAHKKRINDLQEANQDLTLQRDSIINSRTYKISRKISEFYVFFKFKK